MMVIIGNFCFVWAQEYCNMQNEDFSHSNLQEMDAEFEKYQKNRPYLNHPLSTLVTTEGTWDIPYICPVCYP